MFRILSIVITSAVILSMSGCVLGPSVGGQCNSCDGYSGGQMSGGPGASFLEWRKGLTCGPGCGETYYDEWHSSPPDCEDPCPQFAGGGGSCGGGSCGGCGSCGPCLNGGCGGSCGGSCGGGIQPIRTIAGLAVGLYGKRFCGECGYDTGDCCCDTGGCDTGCCDGGCGGEIISEGPVIHGGGGCASGNCAINRGGNTQMARSNVRRSPAHQQAMARQQTAQMMRQVPTSSEPKVVYPEASNQKFYRQATRLPQGQSAFRR